MKSPEASKRKQERLKLVVVPVLVAVLAAVLFWPSSDQADAPLALKPAASVANVSAAQAAPQPTPATPRWPVIELQQITAANPFAKKPIEVIAEPTPDQAGVHSWLQLATDLASLASRSPSIAQRTVTPEAQVTSSPSETPAPAADSVGQVVVAPIDYSTVGQLTAIMHGPNGRSALLGGKRIVHEGDDLPSGFRVVQISEDKIWVRRLAE